MRMLFIDYSSAFYTIVPMKLITKLRTLGLNTSLCNWILDFLTGCSQVVRVGNNTSATLILNTGAPQGCVLRHHRVRPDHQHTAPHTDLIPVPAVYSLIMLFYLVNIF
jgi:hypothetical protein